MYLLFNVVYNRELGERLFSYLAVNCGKRYMRFHSLYLPYLDVNLYERIHITC